MEGVVAAIGEIIGDGPGGSVAAAVALDNADEVEVPKIALVESDGYICVRITTTPCNRNTVAGSDDCRCAGECDLLGSSSDHTSGANEERLD